jgi:hypothetical protein
LPTEAKNKLKTCEKVADQYASMDSMQTQISILQQEKLILETKISGAYQKGYEQAFASFMAISDKYLEHLATPQKDDLFPDWLKMIAGVATGGILCAL